MHSQPSDKLHVGCAGWSIPSQHALRFPTAGSHLERYAREFSAVEINTSFYRPHRPSTYRRWADSVPASFRFSTKMPKLITHTLKLVNAAAPLDVFLGEIAELGAKLGPVLVQLPPSLAFDRSIVHEFWKTVRDRFSGALACEPRHASWFERPADALLTEFRVARVAADPSILPQAQMPGAYTGTAYFRLHGSPRVYYSAYGREFLEELAITLESILSTGADVWCIFDNTAEGAALSNAFELRALLPAHFAERTGKA
jgi:uncharacterized protein YecE (DUF72 family)